MTSTFAEHYLACTERRDPSQMARLYQPDGIIEFGARRVVGRVAIASLFADLWKDVSRVEGTLGRTFVSEHGVAFEWASKATLESGEELAADGVDVMTIVDGLIARSTVYLRTGNLGT